jgi:hypothetical protein
MNIMLLISSLICLVIGMYKNDNIMLLIGLFSWIAFWGMFIIYYIEKLIKK